MDVINAHENDKNNSGLVPPGGKSPGTAVLLSFLFTGTGQIYAGATERGVIQLVIYFVLGLLSFSTGFFFIFSIPYWIWGMFDANLQAENFNAELKSTINKQANIKAEEERHLRQTIHSSEFVNQLEKISKLHEAGLLDDREYLERKNDLIWSLSQRKPRESTEDFLSALIPCYGKKYLVESELAQIKKLVM